MTTTARCVAKLSQLREDRAERVVVDGENILLVRDGAIVHAYGADCPHAGGPLEQGALCNGRIVCPWHKGSFDVTTGSVLEPPPLVALDRYPVRVEGDDVMVTPSKIDASVARVHASEPHYVVIGAGAAGAAACAALRERGFGGRITLIGAEPHAPYDRTALSKFVPAGDMTPDDVPPLLSPEWLEQHAIERIVAELTRLDVPARTLHYDSGGTSAQLTYDTALVATGGTPKLPAIPGCQLGGVHVLRSVDDAAALVDALGDDARDTHVAIVGSSFIGLECASALRKRGVQVSVISPHALPFVKQFGERAGRMFRALHESHGVRFYPDAKVASLEGLEGNVHQLMLEGGETIDADVVLLATGVSPATGFIEGLPLNDDGGVIVNAGMQAAPGLYAAGDIALFPLYGDQQPVRIEHWRVAQQQARVAAENMCGARTRYKEVPFFWTFHYDKTFEYLGHASEWDDIAIEGDLDAHSFIAFYLKDDQVVAILACEHDAHTAQLIEAMEHGLSHRQALAIVEEVTRRQQRSNG